MLSPDGKTLAVSQLGRRIGEPARSGTLKERAASRPAAIRTKWCGSEDRLFVANSGSNSVSVIDDGKVTETIKTSLDPKALVGSTPDALAITRDGKRLYVANADNNDVAVIDIAKDGDSKMLGFIPTGWYPTALAVSADGRKLYVGTGKGLGFRNNFPPQTDYLRTSPDPKKSYDYIGGVLSGAVSVVDVPDARGAGRLHEAGDGQRAGAQAGSEPGDARRPSSATCSPRSSTCSTSFARIAPTTRCSAISASAMATPPSRCSAATSRPNAHAIARRFVTLDNLYCNGEVSEDGHQWCDAAYATDFTEKAWVSKYSKRGQPNLDAKPGGFARRISVGQLRAPRRHLRSYGEGSIAESAPESRAEVRSSRVFSRAMSVRTGRRGFRQDARLICAPTSSSTNCTRASEPADGRSS